MIKKVVTQDILQADPSLNNLEVKGSLDKLSEALVELNTAQNGLDEKVLSYVLQNLYDVSFN